ncbi:MAG: S1 RNA-binding domain-containing protein [bacterium]|nr:S1 RNA-binding domain-containing protein [bacterium]
MPVALLEDTTQKTDTQKPLKMGDIVEGTVIGTGRSAVYLDLGPQGTGIIYGREFLDEKRTLKPLKIGDRIAGKIIELENDEGYIELSLKEAGKELTWDKLQEKKDNEELLSVTVIGANKGGLLAEILGVPAFLPVSQLSQEHYPKIEDGDSTKILLALQKFMGKELEVQIFDLDPTDQKIILSERSKERKKIKEILGQYKIGDMVEGEITGVVDFGAFVKFGKEGEEIEGLIHISEIDWQIIENPGDFVKIGDKVQAKIIDLSNGRASLSLKALKEDPWKEIEKRWKKLDEVQGKVTKLNPFGAFIEIEPKIQGLCHISEFGTRKRMEEVLKQGETYAFQVLEINAIEHRMSLRLKSLDSSRDVSTSDAPAETPESASPTAEPQKTPEPEAPQEG